MKRKILVVLAISLISILVVPSVAHGEQEKNPEQDVMIVTTQKKAPFFLVMNSGKLALKNWKIHFYSMKKNNTYRIIKDGEVLGEGNFTEFHHVVEKTVTKGTVKLLKIKLNGYNYTWKNVNVMRKTPSKEDIKEAVKEKKIKIGEWEFKRTKLVFSAVGAIAALAAMLIMRIMVKRKKENEILEGY